MERRHFQIIADALLVSRPTQPARPNSADLSVMHQWKRTVHVMADAMARENSRFDRARFYAACGETE